MGSLKWTFRMSLVFCSFSSFAIALPIKERTTGSRDYFQEVSSVTEAIGQDEITDINSEALVNGDKIEKDEYLYQMDEIETTYEIENTEDIEIQEDLLSERDVIISEETIELNQTETQSSDDAVTDQQNINLIEYGEVVTPHEITKPDELPVTFNVAAEMRTVRPGQTALSYSLTIEPSGDSFIGRVVIHVVLDQDTIEDPVEFYAEDIDIINVYFGITTIINPLETEYDHNDGILEIFPWVVASSYFFLIEYTGQIRHDGTGLYRGTYDDGDNSYLAMNLYPTHARRVFPCVDEPTNTAALSLIVNNNDYTSLVSNAMNEGNANEARFSPLSTATHLWGLVAHNFQNLQVPVENLRLYGRQGLGTTQTSYAGIMIQSLFLQLNTYTEKPYFEIDANAEQFLHIFAMPDITRDWRSLSTIGIWEPNILMTEVHAIAQRKTALLSISAALAGQWFGYVVFPENWRYSWIIKGLQMHTAIELSEIADPELDMNAVFVADVTYEAMYEDAYSETLPLLSSEYLFDESEIRSHLNGVMKNKAPAIMRMLKLVLGDGNDYMQRAAAALLNVRSLQTVNSLQFSDSVNSGWVFSGDGVIDDVGEFLEPWIENSGYPFIEVSSSTAGNTVVVTQERFSYTNMPNVEFNIPLTFTTRFNPDFENVYPDRILDSSGVSFPVNLLDPEEDWIIFNIQGQGYYRVNYDFNLWERIIWALEDPEQREVIHPLNRAVLVDDALNIARAGRLGYDVAFQVVLTMEHETNYAVWKAFIRNMEFIKKRLDALDDDDYDADIYLRMVRRSIVAVERDLGFDPDPNINEDAMVSLTRGLVMEHACKALYQPCIAAAVDWFWDGNDLNTNIPADLRPAVYCTMVREGGDDAIDLLWEQYENENVQYEKVVILKAMTCSQDSNFIWSLLQETISDTTRYGTEERSIIFRGVAESSTDNANAAFNFFTSNSNAIRNWYGGSEKLEELLMIISENLANHDQTNDFVNWANNRWVIDEDFADVASRAAAHAQENLIWIDSHLEAVYEWIDDNDATGIQVSMGLILFSLIAAFFNR